MWVSVLIFGILGLVGFGLIAAFSILQYGLVVGVEFSPDRFTRRQFVYYEIPLLGLQITPVYRDDLTGELEQYLRRHRLVPLPAVDEPRWDIVMAVRGGRSWRGDAEILCSYLENIQGERPYWLQWSEDHPALAKLLWPAVAEVARTGLYHLVPDLIELASATDDSQSLENELNAVLARSYRRCALLHQQLGEHALAVERFTAALGHREGDAASLRGRAASLAALGKADEAAADLAAAEQASADSRFR